MSSLGSRQQQGFQLQECGTSTVRWDVQDSSFNGEQVLIFSLRTVSPHELCQADQVFYIVARVAFAGDNLGCDLLGRGPAEVHGVIGGGDVDESLHRCLVLLVGEELHGVHDVAPHHDLPYVQVLEALLDLRACYLIGSSPCLSLQGKQQGRWRLVGNCLYLTLFPPSWLGCVSSLSLINFFVKLLIIFASGLFVFYPSCTLCLLFQLWNTFAYWFNHMKFDLASLLHWFGIN